MMMTPRTGRDKTALMFEIAHKPGSLADAMLALKRDRLNLTWIESFPLRNSKNEYLFFVEFEGHQADSIRLNCNSTVQGSSFPLLMGMRT